MYYCIELITPQYRMTVIVILTCLIVWEIITSKSCRRCERLYFFHVPHVLKAQSIQGPRVHFLLLILEYVLYVAISPS